MTYVKIEERKAADKTLDKLIGHLKTLPDDRRDSVVNYSISKIIRTLYMEKYFNFNRAVGILECVKQEFFRRVMGPYEEKHLKDRGDIV